MSLHDFGDMHESALIFVPAATFGQLIAKRFLTAEAHLHCIDNNIVSRDSCDTAR
jgi:hypothetical protein